MARVIGLGGLFWKAEDPKKTYEWYVKHLGIAADAKSGGAMFHWREPDSDAERLTVWSVFPQTSKYFGNDGKQFMMDFIVDDLEGMAAQLEAAGVNVERESHDYGKFGWFTDCDGNKVELWEPAKKP